jgi:hypothetical protein
MKEFLNENTLFSTILMLSEPNSLLLIVEGEYDQLLLKKHCTENLEILSGTGGKEQVLRAASRARKYNLKNVHFLVDRDYDDFSPKYSYSSYDYNVHCSKSHDIFMDLIINDWKNFQYLLEVEAQGCKNLKIPNLIDIKEEAISLASCLAVVRILNVKSDLGLNFKRFSVHKFNTKVNFDITTIEKILNHFETENIESLMTESRNIYNLVSKSVEYIIGDHDLFEAIARGFKSKKGKDIQKTFIFGASCLSITNTNWYSEIQSWCREYNCEGFNCKV